MEIKPLKNSKKPYYAAALAMLSTTLLTGCATGGDVAVEGESPTPIDEQVDLAGDEPVYTERINTEETARETAAACTETTDDGEFMLAGDVVAVPDYSESQEIALNAGKELEQMFIDGFAEQGISLREEPDWILSDVLLKGDIDDENGVSVGFFYGDAMDVGQRMDEYLEENLQNAALRSFDWGYIVESYYDNEDKEYRIALVDLSKVTAMSVERAAEIAQELKK